MRYLNKILIFLTALCLSCCTLFKKQITKPIVVAVPDNTFNVYLNSTAPFTKYVSLTTKEEIAAAFLKAFESEGGLTQNVTYTNDASQADFILKITSVNVKETHSVEKVNDPNSPYNGQSYNLNSIDCTADVDVINAKTKVTVATCSNSKIRSEQLKNNRDLGDLITGSNKDNTNYRTKLLSDNICTNLADDVGRRIWTPITRKLEKNSK